MKIEEFELSVRLYHALQRAGLTTLEQVSDMTEYQFGRLREVGRKTVLEMRGLLHSNGLDWGGNKRAEPVSAYAALRPIYDLKRAGPGIPVHVVLDAISLALQKECCALQAKVVAAMEQAKATT